MRKRSVIGYGKQYVWPARGIAALVFLRGAGNRKKQTKQHRILTFHVSAMKPNRLFEYAPSIDYLISYRSLVPVS
jgi:hypothetical protein